jgi:Spherulation-specific family 4
MPRFSFLSAIALALIASLSRLNAQDTPSDRIERNQVFHSRAQERTGLLVPMYIYPANIHTNPDYNRLIDLKRRHETVPFWVIVNPASGPGAEVDANYTKAIDRLIGAGCIVLGYVSTKYGTRASGDVQADINRWQSLYPRTQGIFFDEMIYEDTAAGSTHQGKLNRYAADAGFWPTVANPGTDTPERYFINDPPTVIVVAEGSTWPTKDRLAGDYFGGYADYPPFTRAVLVYSQSKLDPELVAMTRRYARWIYVTDDLYVHGDPAKPNPWDTLSMHLDALCEQLERP